MLEFYPLWKKGGEKIYFFLYTYNVMCTYIYIHANNNERDETFSGGRILSYLIASTAGYIALTCSRTFALELSIDCVSHLKATINIVHTANRSVLTTKRNYCTKIHILHQLKRYINILGRFERRALFKKLYRFCLLLTALTTVVIVKILTSHNSVRQAYIA